jgi:hypothetical protein
MIYLSLALGSAAQLRLECRSAINASCQEEKREREETREGTMQFL